MLIRKILLIVTSIVLLLLAACGTGNQGYPGSPSYPAASASSTLVSGYGVVQAIDIVPSQSSGGVGMGTVAGAVVGGVLGHQVGQGRGQTAATVAGAAGGALAGQAIQNSNRSGSQVYRITLRMDNGSTQAVVQDAVPGLRVGDRIRVSNGAIERI